MAPQWTRAVRPLVLVLTAGALLITWIFQADVDAQGGAYATGVLVLITSAAVAVTLAARRAGQRRLTVGFGIVATIFVYTTGANVVERPDGVKIAAVFITVILLVSLLSRILRVFELRVTDVTFDRVGRNLPPRLRPAQHSAHRQRTRRARPRRVQRQAPSNHPRQRPHR